MDKVIIFLKILIIFHFQWFDWDYFDFEKEGAGGGGFDHNKSNYVWVYFISLIGKD